MKIKGRKRVLFYRPRLNTRLEMLKTQLMARSSVSGGGGGAGKEVVGNGMNKLLPVLDLIVAIGFSESTVYMFTKLSPQLYFSRYAPVMHQLRLISSAFFVCSLSSHTKPSVVRALYLFFVSWSCASVRVCF